MKTGREKYLARMATTAKKTNLKTKPEKGKTIVSFDSGMKPNHLERSMSISRLVDGMLNPRKFSMPIMERENSR
jgi:hypothetical protein